MEQYGLNNEQWNAVTSKSPSVIYASAGSGKTRCLVARIRYLIDNGANPKNILSVTFTNKAAKEMKERIKTYHNIKDMQMSTIHSLCVRIMKEFIQYTPLKLPFSIYDDSDQMSVIKTILKTRGITTDPYEVLGLIGKTKSEQSEIEDDTLEEIYNKYQKILLKNNACDFDDLLVYANNCLKKEDCRTHFTNLWHHILIDEFQDTSAIQYDIILSIYDPIKTKTMMVFGDQNQSIYSWRGAKPSNMDEFIKKYNPTINHLTYNYRSCSDIINHANSFLQFGKQMVPKSNNTGKVSVSVFRSQEDEATKIADAIKKMGNYEDTTIIYRMNSRSILFERAFAQNRIPYKVIGDMPFYKRKVSKDLLSYLKAASNPDDIESLTRIINVPKRGFGDAKQEKVLSEGWPYINQISQEMPEIKLFVNLLNDIRVMTPMNAIKEIINRTGYRNTLTKDSDISMTEAMIDIASGFDTINEMVLASTFLENDSGNGVKLMTAHASKGLEFKRVFVVGVEQDVWPHARSEDIKEEDRLYYVAITRAMNYLNVSYSMSRLFRGQPIQVSPSYLFIQSSEKLKLLCK